MKVCVFGLWHLGSVTSACLADLGFDTIGLDLDKGIIEGLKQAKAPLYEPGLDELIKQALTKGNLDFCNDPKSALIDADILWITFDTPVDDNDVANTDFVKKNIISVTSLLKKGAKIIISSQVPVGFTRSIEEILAQKYADKKITCVYSPENLRLGKAIQVFNNPGRIVIGVRDRSVVNTLEPFFSKICTNLEWMKTESAEMTKHAINTFLGLSVVYANELAQICEAVGADVKEVERGLKSEERIGPKAYLKAGSAFSGGTLARDINFLIQLAKTNHKNTPLLKAIEESNRYHREWIKQKIKECFPDLQGLKIGMLGLTYKEGTNTLRRSQAVELCQWLHAAGVRVKAFDPQIKSLPAGLDGVISLQGNIMDCIKDTDCIVVATEKQAFRQIDKEVLSLISVKAIIDPNGFLKDFFSRVNANTYHCVGGI